MKFLFIINPISFRTRGEQESFTSEVENYFKDKNSTYLIHVSRFPRDAIGVIRKYVKSSNETVRVFAVGGDGILFDCLNGVIGLPNAELGAIPYGAANDFVRAFGENKLDIFRDITMQAEAGTVLTDAISCGSNYAINFCTVGWESTAITNSIKLRKKIKSRRLITLIYRISGVFSAGDKTITHQYYDLLIDGVNYSGRYGTINISNGPCYGNKSVAVPLAMPNDREIDIMLFKSTYALRALLIMMDYLNGKYYKYPKDFTYLRGKKIEIRSESPLLIDLDGETFYDTNINIEVVPEAIKFVAPNGLTYLRRRVKNG